MNAPVPHPAFAAKLPPKAPTLRQLVEQALTTADAFSAVIGLGQSISDEEYNRADEAAFDAKMALLDHLFAEHGISRSLAARMGDVL